MRRGRTMIYLCFAAIAFFGLMVLSATDASAADENPFVLLDTSAGPITIELDKAKAPISVENFLKYVDEGFYDGLIFHRVIDGFMVQGGGMDDKMGEKTKGAHAPIKNEASNGVSNKRGTLAMARTNNPDSATSQFFVNLVDNARGLDPRSGSAGYSVFGHVTEGMDIVDAIAKTPVGRKGAHDDVPVKPIYIKSAKRKAKA